MRSWLLQWGRIHHRRQSCPVLSVAATNQSGLELLVDVIGVIYSFEEHVRGDDAFALRVSQSANTLRLPSFEFVHLLQLSGHALGGLALGTREGHGED